MADLTGRAIDTGQGYRAQAWVTRVLLVAVLLQTIMIAILGGTLVTLFPLKTIEPMILRSDHQANQIWRVEPFETGTKAWYLIAEMKAKEYVLKRETIDLQTDRERWEHVAWMSSDDVYDAFFNFMSPDKNPESPYTTAVQNRLTRTVEIEVVSRLNDWQYQVEFLRRDFQHGAEIERKRLVATMTVATQEQRMRYEDRYMNPTGWVVVAYGLAEKRSEL